MRKGFEEKWLELREVLRCGVEQECDESKFGNVILWSMAKTMYGIVLKEMDRIEKGYAECDKCGCHMEQVKSTVCEECAKEMLEGSEFKDLLDL